MVQHADKRLSIKRAAELIFRTSKPSAAHLQRVGELIAKGELSGDNRGTTATAVADFIARAAIEKQGSHRAAPSSAMQHRGNSDKLHGVYQQSLQQYFLAVILRRKVHNASRRFKQAVLAGQIALLAGVVLFVLFSMRTIFPPLAPERAAVVQWLEENTDKYRVIEYYPTKTNANGQTQLWVEYHYVTPQGRGADTRRVFTVVGDRVVSVNTEEL